jgi:hypothetical protein
MSATSVNWERVPIGELHEGHRERLSPTVAGRRDDGSMSRVLRFPPIRVREHLFDVLLGDPSFGVILGDVPQVVLPPDSSARLHPASMASRTYTRQYPWCPGCSDYTAFLGARNYPRPYPHPDDSRRYQASQSYHNREYVSLDCRGRMCESPVPDHEHPMRHLREAARTGARHREPVGTTGQAASVDETRLRGPGQRARRRTSQVRTHPTRSRQGRPCRSTRRGRLLARSPCVTPSGRGECRSTHRGSDTWPGRLKCGSGFRS